ncbi:MAG: DNA primase DnaG [Candidatus Micrarchaeaceae archaeon]
MAKTYLDMVKYMVEANFEISGLVEKPDIIGAVFGQTEGLLGDELDLRELQKSGKIGRIEIDTSQSGSKTYGKLMMPASLDKVETCILAAAVESVDRVGPYDAKFHINKVDDMRTEKRKKVLERAKELLKNLLTNQIPDSRELTEIVEADLKISEIATYGPEKLPAGPDVESSDDVILVEGRADVLTLLKNDITNVVAVGGASSSIPKSIIDLMREKEVTAFVDGDRGGDMIVNTLLHYGDLDYVAKAPDGKEVEELTRKEIIKALRSRTPIDQYLNSGKKAPQTQQPEQRFSPQQTQQRKPQQQPQAQMPAQQPKAEQHPVIEPLEEAVNEDLLPTMESQNASEVAESAQQQPKPALESIVLSELAKGLDELSNRLRCRLYDSSGNIIKEGPIRDIFLMINSTEKIYGIVLDGTITQRLVAVAEEKGVKAIYGLRVNPMPRRPPNIIIYAKEGEST